MNGRILVAHVSDASVLQTDVTICAIAPEETLTDQRFAGHVRTVVLSARDCHQIGWAVSAGIELGYAVSVVEVGCDFGAVPAVFVYAAIVANEEFIGGFGQIGEGVVV